MYCSIRYDSPVGGLRVVAGEEGIVALVLDGQKHVAEHVPGDMRNVRDVGPQEEAPEALAWARRWLEAYFAGGRPGTSRLPLAPRGGEFRQRVWRELLKIPYGETDTYGAIAKRLGTSPRAVGGAVGRNPISIMIPCHRVVGAGGNLTGYGGGLGNKIRLLELEGVDMGALRRR